MLAALVLEVITSITTVCSSPSSFPIFTVRSPRCCLWYVVIPFQVTAKWHNSFIPLSSATLRLSWGPQQLVSSLNEKSSQVRVKPRGSWFSFVINKLECSNQPLSCSSTGMSGTKRKVLATTSSCYAGYTGRDPGSVGRGIIPGGKGRRREMVGDKGGTRQLERLMGASISIWDWKFRVLQKTGRPWAFLAELEIRVHSHL